VRTLWTCSGAAAGIGAPPVRIPLSPSRNSQIAQRQRRRYLKNKLGKPRRFDDPRAGFEVRLGPATWILPKYSSTAFVTAPATNRA
jgi:hypothetical protein